MKAVDQRKPLPLFLLFITALTGNIMAFEQPQYQVIKTFRDFELREYQPYLVAETSVSGDFEQAGSSAFSILFNYISGANSSSEKIKMTIPVNQQDKTQGEKISMTAPVTREVDPAKPGSYSIAFVVPSKYSMENVPRPTDPRVNIRRVPARTVAVIRYSGSWKQKNYLKHENILLEALGREGLEPFGQAVFARYNPPFWPNFLNRNEILIEVTAP